MIGNIYIDCSGRLQKDFFFFAFPDITGFYKKPELLEE